MRKLEERSKAAKDLGIDSLTELALNLRSSWHHGADELWMAIDPELWSLTHNPWVVLQSASPKKLQELLERPEFRHRVEALLGHRRQYLASTAWFQRSHSKSDLAGVAYFSMEFALSEALPIYSGGLGNVAGDGLKAASDLGVPVTGIGLLYQQGYFRQVIDPDGSQEALYPFNDPHQLPVIPVRNGGGEWLRFGIRLPGGKMWLRVWQAQVGRVALYLLDTNDPANPPVIRGIASQLYGGGPELRLRQELILGIGGFRLLQELGVNPEVCHLNEGHAALAVLERARIFMEETGRPFDVALEVTRAGNLFTTHTPVPAGFDRFEPALIERYLGRYARERLGIDVQRLLALGRANPGDAAEPFNMAYLAIRGSGAVNGVSRLHGSVSRQIFEPLFPRWPPAEVPVGHVTNGVHTPSWDSAEADALWTRACGSECWRGTLEAIEDKLAAASDAELWSMRAGGRRALVEHVRERLERQPVPLDATTEEIAGRSVELDPDALTIGFARRFAPYKRPNLLLHDPERLLRILTGDRRPVQLVLAGKAHPADLTGQRMIAEWVRFIRRPQACGHVVFVPDYDLLLAEQLVQGVDLWLNTPRRPWEASGTSGMKVLVNGGLNLSELDGWWAEAYRPEVGWALGDGREHGDDPSWDAVEAEELYWLLEEEVLPAFYTRDAGGIPAGWVAKMRASMGLLTPRFSANRAVREYTETYYLKAAEGYRKRAADKGALGAELLEWRRGIAERWHEARFGAVRTETRGNDLLFVVEVHLGGLDPEAVRVELYADPLDGGPPERHLMERARRLEGDSGGHEYRASVSASRPADHYTPRLVPYHPAAAVPLEAQEILWQR